MGLIRLFDMQPRIGWWMVRGWFGLRRIAARRPLIGPLRSRAPSVEPVSESRGSEVPSPAAVHQPLLKEQRMASRKGFEPLFHG